MAKVTMRCGTSPSNSRRLTRPLCSLGLRLHSGDHSIERRPDGSRLFIWFWITFEHGAHWDEKLITNPGLTSGAHSVSKNEGAEAHPNILWEADLYKRLAANRFGKASTLREFHYPSGSTIEFIWRPMDWGFRIAAPTFNCAVEIMHTGGRLIIRGSDHNPIIQKILTLTDKAQLFEDDYTVSFTGSFDSFGTASAKVDLRG